MKLKTLVASIAVALALFANFVSVQPTFAGESTSTPNPVVPASSPNGFVWEC